MEWDGRRRGSLVDLKRRGNFVARTECHRAVSDERAVEEWGRFRVKRHLHRA